MSELFSCINISGADSYKFLQGQITANLDDLNTPASKPILSAYCNVKGRVISVFYIAKQSENNYDFLFLGDTEDIFVKKIKKYSVFSKIQFSEAEFITDYLPENFKSLNLDLNYLIENKIPIVTSDSSELFLPDNINLIELNAVSFKKGCFLGQEIIARVYYKGKTKQKLYLIKSDHNFNCVPGESILLNTADKTIAGQIVYTDKNIGCAVIEDRFLEQPLVVGGVGIVVEV